MRVLLVQPWLGRRQHPVLPLGLACIAASLEGHEVRIVDPNLHEEPLDLLAAELRDFAPDVTGFSLRNCDTTSRRDPFTYLPAFRAQTELARRKLPSTRIMAGGAGFSLFAEQIMRECRNIDCGVTGHAEAVVRELMESGATGLHAGGSGQFVSPALELLDCSRYTPFETNLAVGVEVARGCDLGCRYCSYPAVSGDRTIHRPPSELAEELGRLVSLGARHIFLIAPVLNRPAKQGAAAARAAMEAGGGFTWEAYHTARGFDREYAELAASSGCTGATFSPDGGTDRQMELMGKDYDGAALERAITAAADAGIDVSINVFPWQRETGFSGMLAAFRGAARWGAAAGERLRRLRFGLVRRMPGTDYAPAAPAFGRAIPDGQFSKPPPAAMVGFLAFNRLFGKDLRQ